MFKISSVVVLLLMGLSTVAQNKLSFDLAAIRNMRQSTNGSNISCFYHFSERITGGVEMNRFYPVKKMVAEEAVKSSAWDFDLNFHYLIPLNKKTTFYPLTGISHTSEKEYIIATGESLYTKFWSYNTGAGLLYECGRWAPHIEYSYTWGHINQQFLLAGISYELEWGNHKKESR